MGNRKYAKGVGCMSCIKDSMSELPYIIAVDFDGTLVEDKYPLIGRKNQAVFDYVLSLKEQYSARVVLWTCRDRKYLQQAIEYCRLNGLEFDAVNDNVTEVIELFNNNSRKIYADIYIDDKNVSVGGAEINAFRKYHSK